MNVVQRIREYHLPEGDVLAAVTPIRPPRLRSVWFSENEADVLQNVGEGLCKLGCPESGVVLLELAKAWRREA